MKMEYVVADAGIKSVGFPMRNGICSSKSNSVRVKLKLTTHPANTIWFIKWGIMNQLSQHQMYSQLSQTQQAQNACVGMASSLSATSNLPPLDTRVISKEHEWLQTKQWIHLSTWHITVVL